MVDQILVVIVNVVRFWDNRYTLCDLHLSQMYSKGYITQPPSILYIYVYIDWLKAISMVEYLFHICEDNLSASYLKQQ